MRAETARNLIAILVLILVWAVMAVQAGCATIYHAERTDPDTGAHTVLDVKSFREFEGGIVVRYNRENGAFELEAGEVSQASALEEAAAAILLRQVSE